MTGPLRWGIVSAGRICRDFVSALQILGSDKHVVKAIAARSLESAKRFAQDFGIPKYYEGYEALGDDPEVDVVYIGSVNVTHLSSGSALMAAGKHVVCEKPLCMSLEETKKLIENARKSNVFFMEAMWSRINPVYRELQSRLERKEIGEVSHVTLTFGVDMSEVDRVYKKEIGGGLLLDFGIYPINIIIQAMGDERPVEIQAMAKLNEHGMDTEVTGTMRFSKDRFGTFALSTSTFLPNEAVISGSKGSIKLSAPFWSTLSLSGPSGDFKVDLAPTDKTFIYRNSQLLTFEAEEVARCLREGLKECPLVPHSLSLLYAELLEEVAKKAGVKY